MVILVGIGEKLAERFLPLYLMVLGGGIISVGALNALDNFLSAIYSFVGGVCADRFGEKKSLQIFTFLAIFGFLIVVLVPRWEAVLIASFFFLSWTAISLPSTMSLVSKVLPKDKRTMGVSIHSLVRRIPMAIGPLIGGILIDVFGTQQGVRFSFFLAILMGIIALYLQGKFIVELKSDRHSRDHNPFKLFKLMSPQLRNVLVSDILVRFCEQIPYAFVVLWCLQNIKYPVSATQFGILTSIEMVTAVLIYIPVAHFADQGEKRPFVITTFLFFSAFPLVLYFCHSFWPLAFAFFIRGLKEFGEPTRKALILELSPVDRKAGMFGLYYLLRDTVVSIAAFAGAFLWQISPTLNLFSACTFGLLGTIWFALYAKDEKLFKIDKGIP